MELELYRKAASGTKDSFLSSRQAPSISLFSLALALTLKPFPTFQRELLDTFRKSRLYLSFFFHVPYGFVEDGTQTQLWRL